LKPSKGVQANHNCSHTTGSLDSAGSPDEPVVSLNEQVAELLLLSTTRISARHSTNFVQLATGKNFDDPTSAEVEKCFAESFIVDVRSLTLNATTNRDLDERMVERLKVQFLALIRRYTFADRNLVITTKATFNHIVKHLAAAIK
jgi:hypothetical protein